MKSNIPSLEEFEKTVFEFTKALAVNENKGDVSKRLFDKAKELAIKWYEDTEQRQAYHVREIITEDDWEKINKDSDYFEEDFKRKTAYWVVTEDCEDPIQVLFAGIRGSNERQQPFFHTAKDSGHLFEIKSYLSESIGNKLTTETPPYFPYKREETPRRNRYAVAGPRVF